MQKFHRGITLERFDKFTSESFFSDVNLISQLYKSQSTAGVTLEAFSVPDLKRITFHEAVSSIEKYKPAKVGDRFGPSWSTVWFKVCVQLASDMKDGEIIHFLWDADCEGMVWSVDGRPIQGLTGGNGGDRRADHVLTFNSSADQVFEFYIEMACNGMFGVGYNGQINPPDPSRYFTLKTAQIAVLNKPIWDILYDFQIISAIAKEIPSDSQISSDALIVANNMINTFYPQSPETWTKTLEISKAFLSRAQNSPAHRISAIGHCHIDTAWLWPYDETKRKCARSWSSQIDLMKRYPEYKFACSQAQQFEWIEILYPTLFEEMKQFIESGQFIPIGGAWVEMDCNIPSGESFCRQFLYGQRYFEKKFGARNKIFWLPDTFGYAAQLPQIMKLADLDFFLTQKLSWNNINKFPHTTFFWTGLDGTQVLTHFPPADSYCSQATVKEVVYAEKNHKDKLASNECMYVFGNGDGGGGPLASMLERLRRMRNLTGLPSIECEDPNTFFKRVAANSNNLVEWKGELYFELHRGTYTSQAKNKMYNRKSEYLLRDIEFLSTIALVSGEKYPNEEIERLWKLVLLNQFHDVLPGSSIEMVFEDSTRMYLDIMRSGSALRDRAFDVVMSKNLNPSNGNPGLFYVNTLNIDRLEVVAVPLDEASRFVTIETKDRPSSFVEVNILKNIPFKQISEGKGLAIVNAKSLSACSATIMMDPKYAASSKFQDGKFILENYFVQAIFDKSARLTSLIDKSTKRELVAQNLKGNVFKIYEDIPIFWDAWDVEVYHLEKGIEAGVCQAEIFENGPVRSSIVVTHILTPTSTLKQVISLTAVSPRVDFETTVQWNENRKFLKVEFPLNIQSDFATYETAYGWVQRPTHFNTTWDLAKFEVCGHKFADLSEYGYGVSLLNDCKYGYAIHGNVMRLSLLRAPKAPDANCDIGEHCFKYALYPHKGTFAESDVVNEGLKFNVPLITQFVSNIDTSLQPIQFISVSAKNILLDAVKKAEDSNDIILRLYEAYGGRGIFKLNTIWNVSSAQIVNILEEKLQDITWDGGCEIQYSPFQIITIKLCIK